MDLPGPFATWFRRGSADAKRGRSVCGTAIEDYKLEAHSEEWLNCAIPEARRPARREDSNPAARRMLACARFIRRSCPSHPSPSQLEIQNARKPAGANRWGTKGPKLARCRNFSEIPPRENSKAVFRGKLDRPCRACRIGLTEERGTHHSDDPGDVRMIDGIERVHAEFQAAPRTATLADRDALKAEQLRDTQVELYRSRAAACVSRHSGGPRDGVTAGI